MQQGVEIAVSKSILQGPTRGIHRACGFPDPANRALRILADGYLMRGATASARQSGGWQRVWAESFFLTVVSGDRLHTLQVRNGRVIASREGDQSSWADEAIHPGGAEMPILVFSATWGDHHRELEDKRMFQCAGLPRAFHGTCWTVSPDDRLCLLSDEEAQPGKSYLAALQAPTVDHSGWVFLRDPLDRDQSQAIRFVKGHKQWIVPVDGSGRAAAPRTLLEINPGWAAEHPVDGPAGHCMVLGSDYTQAGGDVPRWLDPQSPDSVCASGCRWFMHLDQMGDGRHEWGICRSPKSPRRGLLTWEHQAGHDCFEDDRVPVVQALATTEG